MVVVKSQEPVVISPGGLISLDSRCNIMRSITSLLCGCLISLLVLFTIGAGAQAALAEDGYAHADRAAIYRLLARHRKKADDQSNRSSRNFKSQNISSKRGRFSQFGTFKAHAYDQDYFDEFISIGHGYIWPQEKMPIKVFVPTQEKFQKQNLQADVNRCLSEWVSACPNRISFRLVPDRAQADIVFLIEDHMLPGGASGHTEHLRATPGKFNVYDAFAARIHLAPTVVNGLFNRESMHRCVLHELGHALGIYGHSCNGTDIMFSRQSLNLDHHWPVLSKRDLRTLAHLYSKSCYKDAQAALLREAAKGNPFAQTNLGHVFQNGSGVKQDFQQAVNWYRQAANKGLDEARACLGFMYESGLGVKQDYKQAVYWLQKSAGQGCAYGQLRLGLAYENGLGVRQDYQRAANLYMKSAKHYNGEAQKCLGAIYEFGHGVRKDYKQALYWYQQAADQYIAEAQVRLGLFYENGSGVQQNYEQALKWYKKAACQGSGDAQRRIKTLKQKMGHKNLPVHD